MSEENGYLDPEDRVGRPDGDEVLTARSKKPWRALVDLYESNELPGRPQPPVPGDLDLRDMPSMLLDVARLRNSAIARLPNAEAFRAAVMLWCASWHEVPAASLPTDDMHLCYLAGFGRDLTAWQAIREQALHGYYECADGRLYHPVVAEKAIDAAVKRKGYKEKMEKARTALEAKRAIMPAPIKVPMIDTIKESIIELPIDHKESKVKEKEDKKEPSLREGRRATRLPRDFQLTDEMREFARTLLHEGQIEPEFAQFCDHWWSSSGPKAAKLDWIAAWRTWVRNSLKFNGGRNGRPDRSANAAAQRIKDHFGGDAAARAYVPGSAGPTLSLDYGTGPTDPKRLPKG